MIYYRDTDEDSKLERIGDADALQLAVFVRFAVVDHVTLLTK